MKKNLLFILLFLLPFFSFAQDPVLYKDFASKVKSISSVHFSDQLSVMLIRVDDESFNVLGINDQMAIVWQKSFTGYAMSLAKFKGQIIAIASTEHSMMKGSNNTYKGFLINPENGEQIVEKTIFEDSPDFTDIPEILISNDVFWGIGVRQTNFKRQVHVALPSLFALISIAKYKRQYRETQDLDLIQFTDKLEIENSFKPQKETTGTFLNMTTNDHGDVFISWAINGLINVYRYEYGKKQLSGSIKSDLTVSDNFLDENPLSFAPSSADRNTIYFGAFFDNDGKNTLWTECLNTGTGKKKNVMEAFDRTHVKELTKAFVKPNKKIDDPDMGSVKKLRIKQFGLIDGVFIAVISSVGEGSTASNMTYRDERGILINGYSPSLEIKFQQFLPAAYTALYSLPSGLYAKSNKLYVIANDKSGMNTFNAQYGTLDLSTGQWDNMLHLSKKHIDNTGFPDGSSALWFADTFALPYLTPKGLSANKYDVLLQQNPY